MQKWWMLIEQACNGISRITVGIGRNFYTVLYTIYISLIVAVLQCQYSSKNYLKFHCRKQVHYLANAFHFLFFFPFIIPSVLDHQMVVLSRQPRAIPIYMIAIAGNQGYILEYVCMINSSCLDNTLYNKHHCEGNG